MKNVQKRVFNLVRDDERNSWSGTIFNSVIIVFIVINVVFVILDTFDMPAGYLAVSRVIEFVAVVIFTIVYILRLRTAPLLYPEKKPWRARLRYAFSFMALIDLFSILPIYLPFFIKVDLRVLMSLRIIRLVRIFKLSRYTDTLTLLTRVLKSKARQLISSTAVVLILMIIASVVMYSLEHEVQPERFDNAFSAFWWAVSTVTTIGYGDLYPITTPGKIIGTVIALLGVALIAVPTGIISAGFIEASKTDEKIIDRQHGDTQENASPPVPSYCPYCGNTIEELQNHHNH